MKKKVINEGVQFPILLLNTSPKIKGQPYNFLIEMRTIISTLNPSTIIPPFPWSQQIALVIHLWNNPHHTFSWPQRSTVSLEPYLTKEYPCLLCDTILINLIARDLRCEWSPDGLFLPDPR